jgi:RsiW-degrading membrane proteinase PrsW (M82 family)
MLFNMKIRFFQHRWFQILVGGILLFIITESALVTTNNPLLLPTVILVGALAVPVTFVTYFYEYVRDRDISMPLLTTCFLVGGLVGLVAAGVLEYRTLRNAGVFSLLGIGLIEEAAKLIFPVAMFAGWKYRHEADGLLFGIAAGMGFAALETMGYAMVYLIQSRGNISVLQQVLLIRGLLSPAGHAAWTGFVCAVLWRQRQRTGHPLTLPVIGAFLLAVVLHTLWDVVNSMNTRNPTEFTIYVIAMLAVITAGLSLIIWRYRTARRAIAGTIHTPD